MPSFCFVFPNSRLLSYCACPVLERGWLCDDVTEDFAVDQLIKIYNMCFPKSVRFDFTKPNWFLTESNFWILKPSLHDHRQRDFYCLFGILLVSNLFNIRQQTRVNNLVQAFDQLCIVGSGIQYCPFNIQWIGYMFCR